MIHRTTNISLSRTQVGTSTDFRPHLAQSKKNPGCPFQRGELISSRGIPRAWDIHVVRVVRTHTRAHHVHTWRPSRRVVRGDPREAISSIYRQRLHGSFAEPLPPGFRRARHFTYAAECPRANISDANVTGYVGYPCCGFRPPSSFCRRQRTAFSASSIHARVPTGAT